MEAFARSNHVMFRHPVSKRPVLLGGEVDGVVVPDAWEWNGHRFTKVSPDVGSYPTLMPVGRTHSAVATMPDGRVFLFGGTYAGNALVDLWELDLNGVWNRRPLKGAAWPQARRGHAMAYDPTSGKVLLFGGLDGAQTALDDTWLLDPATCTWEQMAPSASPVPRYDTALCVFRDQLYLFGGFDPGITDDFYRWTGSTWETVSTATIPDARGGHLLLSVADRLLVIGGPTGTEFTFSYDGTDWTEVPPGLNLPDHDRCWGAGLADALGAVVCSGESTSGYLEDVWEALAGNSLWWNKDIQLASEPASDRGALLAWNTDAGELQLNVGGDMVLGSSAPVKRKLKIGDKVRIQQTATPGFSMYGLTGTFSCPQPPAGTAWKVSLLVDEVECGSRVFDRARTNVSLGDMAFNTYRVRATNCTLAIQLELIAA